MCGYYDDYLFMFSQRPDEEAVVDQGGTSTILNIHYEKEELEGKNCCSTNGGNGERQPCARDSFVIRRRV